MGVCIEIMTNLWDRILLRLIGKYDPSNEFDNVLFCCSNCKVLISSDSPVFLANDHSYCSETCRVLGVVKPEIRQHLIEKASELGLSIPSDHSFKCQ